MSTKGIVTELKAQLSASAAQYGFRKRGDTLYRQHETRRDILRMQTNWNNAGYSTLEFEVGVRYEEIETLANRFRPGLPEEVAEWTATVGNRLDNMLGLPIIYFIEPGHRVDQLQRRTLCLFRALILPFFDRFASSVELLRVLALDDAEADQYVLPENSRAMRALAAAFVLKDREAFDRLVVSKTAYLEGLAAHGGFVAEQMPQFTALRDYLTAAWRA